MTGTQLAATLARIGWGATALAMHLGMSRQGVQQWLIGRVRVPQDVADWLARVDAHLAKSPPPRRR